MGQGIKDFNTNVGNWFSDLWNNNLKPAFENMGQGIKDFSTNVGDWFSGLGDKLGEWFSNLWLNLADIISYINPFSENFFAYKFIDLLKDLLKALFVPDDEHITSLVDSVKSKFGFIDTIKSTSSEIKSMFEGDENLPHITISIPKNKWYIQDSFTIDFSWYAQYKEYGDKIIAGFLYILFFWRIFVKLPSIIAGAGGDVQSGVEVYNDPDHLNRR